MKKRHYLTSAAAAALGISILTMNASTAFADDHVNTHVNEHTNKHTNLHTNSHTNVHVNSHLNEHINLQVNEHINVHTNVHVNEHSNVDIHVNGSADELVAALKAMNCGSVDYLTSYLESCQWTDSDIANVHIHVNEMEHLTANLHNNVHVTVEQEQAIWNCFIKIMNCSHINVTLLDDEGHTCDVTQLGEHTNVHCVLKDQHGHILCTIQPDKGDTAGSLTGDAHHIEKAVQAAKSVSSGGSTQATHARELPKTATNEPLMLVLAAILLLLGGGLMIPAYLHRKGRL